MAKKPTIETIDASLARWKTRLKRAMTAIDKLEKQKKRLMKAAAMPPKPKPEPLAVTIMREMAAPVVDKSVENSAAVAEVQKQPDDGGIPAFLRRQSEPDPVAEQIRREQAETKRLKSQGRIAKMKAKKSGETKKMPLTGKAALEAIRNG